MMSVNTILRHVTTAMTALLYEGLLEERNYCFDERSWFSAEDVYFATNLFDAFPHSTESNSCILNQRTHGSGSRHTHAEIADPHIHPVCLLMNFYASVVTP